MDGAAAPPPAGPTVSEALVEDLRGFAPFVQKGETGAEAEFMVEGMHCGGCVARIERALAARPEVTAARANLTSQRLHVAWQGDAENVAAIAAAVGDLGFRLTPIDATLAAQAKLTEERRLLIAMAVAGFAAANVMLLSVSLWAGHTGEMDPATRDLLHWFSALVALPAIVYAGRPFFGSALRSLRAGALNMDVPISVAIALAAGVSLWETVRGGEHVWFDSAITLLFFLLLGRYLERRARGRARAAAERFFALQGTAVTVLTDAGPRPLRPEEVRVGDTVLVAAGERLGVDGTVADGVSDIDCSLLTGEAAPVPAAPGAAVFAGTTNLGAPLQVRTTATGQDTVLSEVARLMAQAEARRGRFVLLADRVARLYAPVVHIVAAATFFGWWTLGGVSAAEAVLYAIAVLIITCPCAMGLAIPAVQVAAIGRLMKQGILVKAGDVLERLTQVDTIVFDKTGTLTESRPRLLNPEAVSTEDLVFAASLAACSRHPLSRALVAAAPDIAPASGVEEVPGCGLRRVTGDGEIRLGRRGWAAPDAPGDTAEATMELWLRRPGCAPVRFAFGAAMKSDAADTVDELRWRGYRVILLSGDRESAVQAAARELGIGEAHGAQSPADKCAFLERLAAEGHRPLMVGDGLNDAPSLAAAHASLSPSSAADISQTAADAIFQGERLAPVIDLLDVAGQSGRLVRENMAISLAYNVATVPLAIAGLVTPLVAAVCMSASSLAVVGNALRIRLRGGG